MEFEMISTGEKKFVLTFTEKEVHQIKDDLRILNSEDEILLSDSGVKLLGILSGVC